MGINQTQYRIDIEGFQHALSIIHSDPVARLEIEPHRVQLTISGQYAWNVHDTDEIAAVLERTVERFYRNDTDRIEPVLDKSVKPNRQFVVIVQSDGVCDYIHDAARGHQVSPNIIEAVLTDYRRDDCFTLVFGLDEQSPFILPNSAKPDTLSEDIPFAYKDAIGRIFQGPEGWGGEFTLGMIQIQLKAEFVGPETVRVELEFIVNTCNNFAIGSERDL